MSKMSLTSKIMLCSVLLLLAICVFSFTLTHEVKAQPVYNDPLDCNETVLPCSTAWTTGLITVPAPPTFVICSTFTVEYRWRNCGDKSQIQLVGIRGISPSNCWNELINRLYYTQSTPFVPNEIAIREFFMEIFTLVAQQHFISFYNSLPPVFQERLECTVPDTNYVEYVEGFASSCFAQCAAYYPETELQPERTVLDWIPCDKLCCIVKFRQCFDKTTNTVRTSTIYYQQGPTSCVAWRVPKSTCVTEPDIPGVIHLEPNQCFNFCHELNTK